MKTDMKAKLRRHEMCIGTHVSLNEAVVTEMMGYLPYDYLWIDMEHSVINTERLLGQLIAARASGINAIVRIPANDPILAKPVLDAGADGIIFPMIRGYDDAARAMEACMYPPRGVRGYGPWRAYRFGTINGADYRATVDDTLLRFIQIEEMGAIRELDKILTIDAIDAFIFGPNDLSGSMGKLGQTNDPEVRAVIDEAIAKINAAGKVAGVSLGLANEKTMRSWYDRGVRMLSSGYDVKYIMAGAQANLANMRAAFHLEDK